MNSTEELEEPTIMAGGGKESFFSYVFNLSSTEKNEILNLIQYVLLAIIPVTILLKLLKTYMPVENTKKASIEILIEVILELVIIFVVFFFIHRMIMFIPTYTHSPYPRLNIIQFVIPVFFLLITMKTPISDKMSILLERVLIMLGLSKEIEDDDVKQKRKSAYGPPEIDNPMMQSHMTGNFLPPPVNTMKETIGQPHSQMAFQQNIDMSPPPYSMAGGYGLQEPMASNEAGVSFLY